jgi:hypothetical protein
MDRYAQYRVTLTTADPEVSPRLEEITLDWTTAAGIPAEPAPARPSPLRCVPNPTQGAAMLEFELAVPGRARLSVFDVSGRLLRTVADARFAAGHHAVAVPRLPSGVYLCRLELDGTESWKRMVVAR